MSKKAVKNTLFCLLLVCLSLAKGIYDLIVNENIFAFDSAALFTAALICAMLCVCLRASYKTLAFTCAVLTALSFEIYTVFFTLLPVFTGLQMLKLCGQGDARGGEKTFFSVINLGAAASGIAAAVFSLCLYASPGFSGLSDRHIRLTLFLAGAVCLAVFAVIAAISARRYSGDAPGTYEQFFLPYRNLCSAIVRSKNKKIISAPLRVNIMYFLLPALFALTLIAFNRPVAFVPGRAAELVSFACLTVILILYLCGRNAFAFDIDKAAGRFLLSGIKPGTPEK